MSLLPRKILITGIQGYLGSKLASKLSDRYQVCGFDIREPLVGAPDKIRVYNADRCELTEVLQQEEIDTIIHTATLYQTEESEWRKVARVNLDRSLDYLDAALRSKVKCFINTDTVLGKQVNSYALSKRQFAEWLYLTRNRMKCLNVQLEYFYGPGAGKTNFIFSMVSRLLAKEQLIPLTDGLQVRDFIHIEDVLRAYESILEHLSCMPEAYYDFHVCSKSPMKIRDLVVFLHQLTQSESQLGFGQLPRRPSDDGSCVIAQNLVPIPDWEPQISMEEGVKGLIAYAKSQN